MDPRISVITLGVSELQRSFRFYKEGLGLPTKMTPDGAGLWGLGSGVLRPMEV